MIKLLKGLMITLSATFRTPVTGEYPIPEKRIPVKNKFMGFPALTYDFEIDEPYCTGCMVCIRNCPTACMSANMKDNEKFTENKSSRKNRGTPKKPKDSPEK